MSIERIALSEVVELIDSTVSGTVLVLLLDAEGTAALRSALRERSTARAIRWLALRSNEQPDDFALRLVGLLDCAEIDEPVRDSAALVDRTLDALIESHVEYSLILEGVEDVADSRVLSIIGYLIDFLPRALNVVFIGTASGIGIPRLLVRARVRIFSVDTGCT